MLPASSVKRSIPAVSKNSALLVYNANAPIALCATVSGRTTIERSPDLACIFRKIRPSSFCTSLDIMAALSRIARAARVFSGWRPRPSRKERGSQPSPAHRGPPTGDNLRLAGIYEGNPGHLKFAMLDSDTAGIVKEILAVAHTYPEGCDSTYHGVQSINASKLGLRSLAIHMVASRSSGGRNGDQQRRGAAHISAPLASRNRRAASASRACKS